MEISLSSLGNFHITQPFSVCVKVESVCDMAEFVCDSAESPSAFRQIENFAIYTQITVQVTNQRFLYPLYQPAW